MRGKAPPCSRLRFASAGQGLPHPQLRKCTQASRQSPWKRLHDPYKTWLWLFSANNIMLSLVYDLALPCCLLKGRLRLSVSPHRRLASLRLSASPFGCPLPAARCLLPAACGLHFTRPFASCYKGHRSVKQSGPLGPDFDLPLRERLPAQGEIIGQNWSSPCALRSHLVLSVSGLLLGTSLRRSHGYLI
jgi:hypothetical protein